MTDARERYVPPRGSIPTLDVPSLDGVARLHLIGIGGAGMRNLAKLLLARGIAVSGSDLKDSKGLGELRALGADVAVGHDPAHVGDPVPDAVVVSSAIGDRNVELAKRPSSRACRYGLGRRRSRPSRPGSAASPSRERTARPRRPPWWPWCSSERASTRASWSAAT